MSKVYLHGRLAKIFGSVFTFNVKTPGEAIRALAANFPNFVKVMREGSYRVIRGKRRGGKDLSLEDLEIQIGENDLHILPVIAGSKNSGGLIKILVGVALIGAAVFFAPAAGLSAPLASTGILANFSYGSVALLGLGIAAAGAASLLSNQESTNGTSSYTLNGPTNMDTQGNPVQLIYGFSVAVGSQLISVGYDVEQLNPS